MLVWPSFERSRLLVTCSTLVVASACAEVPEFTSLDTPLPTAFASTPDALMPRQVDVIWWRHLHDETINTLVQTIYADNLTLGIAALRVTEAETLRQSVGSALSASGSVSSLARRDLETKDTDTGSTANFGLNWLFDPFGQRAASEEIAQNNIALAKGELAAARQVVVATLLNTYVDLRLQQTRRANLRSEISRRQSTISQQQRAAQAGDVTEIELTNARAQLANRRAELPVIEADIATLQNQIAILAGVAPGTLDIDLATAKPQPLPQAAPTIGLPVDLLRNRPDLFVLERAYYTARLNVTQARANLYPRLSLGGTLAFNTIGASTGTASFGPSIELPALPNGSVKADIAASEIRVQIAFDEWKQAVLEAVSETETAMMSVHANAEALKSADQSVALSRRSLELTQRVLSFDGATLDDVTTAEDRVAQAELTRARLRQAYARAFVNLQIQLGSGEVLALQDAQQ